ncbi:SpoIIE family protein phosphatase [Actinoplanes sp. KI2]|uniref:SpoIIE family protein phosphatase n=1 Tax=Actinoplanes sp. KI2 TaxID=2983315 RepID=UPI0021D57592|nr:SpoIIE family protein phosphatase [Actinoplanes sp. KI2]MCU7725251.1 SpoIIE family protein phosphatase [Actinoplanes sp. KI2]
MGARADAAFDRIAVLVERLIETPVALVTVLGADRQYLPGQTGLPGPLAEAREMPLSHSLSRHVVEDGELLIVPDTRVDPRMRDSPAVHELRFVAYAGVPLTDSDGHVLGTLAVMDSEPRAWTRSEVALLVELGEVCSSELRLRIAREIADEARRAAESAHDQLSLLGELTETLTATMDIDESLGRLGQTVAGRLADWCVVALAEPSGTVRHVSAAHHDPAYAESVQHLARLAAAAPREMKSLVAAVQRAALPIRAEAADPALLRARIRPAEVAEVAERIGLGSYLIAPITAPVGRRIVGVVILVNGPDRRPFGEAEERTAVEIGRRAGLAVDNNRLYRRQRHVAEVLQQSMLPELPEIPGIELYARYLPAQSGAAVGGDWYDAFVQPDGSVMLAVGDVAGHDIEAAATMGQVRNLVRGDAYGRDDEPGPLLAQLDRALHGLGMPAAATAVLVRLRRDDDGYDLTFANAGHPPPVLLRPDGEVEVWWETPEPLLGLVPRDERSTYRRRIPPGSALMLYTDGLVESPAQLIDDGIRRIREAIGGKAALPTDDLCTLLLSTAPRRDDDVAILVIRVS